MSPLELTPDELERVLRDAELEVVGRMRYSSNATFLVEATLDDVTIAGVYKPQRGERPLWDFPHGTLCHREVAAYELSHALGWDVVPLTVLRATPDTRYLVVEMGARGVGHIRQLCGIAPPHVAAVLNVGSAHIGEFGSREAIALAKGEIVEALGPDGTAVLNADDELVAAMSARTVATVTTFGTPPADVAVSGVTADALLR